MKISIIIPCYNAESYIEKCMSTILLDELKEKEIIFINDGSKDDTLKLLRGLESKYSNVVIIDQENSGQAVARNKGLKKATGEYIFFLDVDDYVEKNVFKKMYDYALKNNSDYVYSDYYEHYSNQDKIVKNNHGAEEKKDALLANFAPWGKLISKKLIDKVNFQFCEGRIFEDIAVIPHLAACSDHPIYLNEALYYYNMTNTSTMRQKHYNKKYEDMMYISDYMYELFQKDHFIEPYYEELQYIYLDGILKSGVLKFAKYKEGIKYIPILRKNVKQKFSKLLKNKYYKREPFYRKFTAFISIYFPPYILYIFKSMKK